MITTIPDEERIVKLDDGTELYIRNPSRAIRENAESEGTKAYLRAIENGCKFRSQMITWLKDQGVWDDAETEEEALRIQQEITILIDKIDGGDIRLSDAKMFAIRIYQLRAQLASIISQKMSYLSETVESKKRNAEFNYMIFACVVYNNDRRKQYYPTYDDYLNAQDTEESDYIATQCARILNGTPNLDNTPEKKFLKEHGFVDHKMRLINADGHLVDYDGKLIDEEGNYIKYVGEGADKKVVLVDSEGEEWKPRERKPFLDDNDKPIGIEAEAETEEEKPKAKPKTPRKPRVKKTEENNS